MARLVCERRERVRDEGVERVDGEEEWHCGTDEIILGGRCEKLETEVLGGEKAEAGRGVAFGGARKAWR